MSDAQSEAGSAEVFSPIRWAGDHLLLLDQTVLPEREEWLECREVEPIAQAIERLSVRGAPAIGVTAAFGLAVGVLRGGPEAFDSAAERLLATRPTAVNLRWAIEQGRALRDRIEREGTPDDELADRLVAWAQELHCDDIERCLAIGRSGAGLFGPASRLLTHCNAGALATGGYGTAVGVLASAHDAGNLGQVWVDETRPLLQGARLTAWELERLGIPHRLVTDNSVGALMTRGLVDGVVVGADRIAANGDVANKIGTYVVAVLAARHGVPFYVAAPRSTLDPDTPSGADIPIEERDELEVAEAFGRRIAPAAVRATNIAFDVTPAELVAGIITEVGVLRPPYTESIARALALEPGETLAAATPLS